MSQSTFQERLNRLDARQAVHPSPDPATEPAREPPSSFGPGKIVIAIFMGLVLIPVGIAFAFTSRVALDHDFTPEAVDYTNVLVALGVFYASVLTGLVVAVVRRFSSPLLNLALIFTLGSYGLFSALLAVAIK